MLPSEGPLQLDPPAAVADLRDSLVNRPGYQWVRTMFARHRLMEFPARPPAGHRREAADVDPGTLAGQASVPPT